MLNNGRIVAGLGADGVSLVLTDTTSGPSATRVTALNDSTAADDLGLLGQSYSGTIQGKQVYAGLNTVLLGSLNGGSGVTLGVLDITDRKGASATVDLSRVQTVSGLLAAINAAETGVVARLNDAGTGIVLEDTTGGAGDLVISGDAADSLGIAVSGNATSVSSGNLQLQYVSGNTLLSDLNAGNGVSPGKFKITDSQGKAQSFTISDKISTLGQVIGMINSSSLGVKASINRSGDGLLLTDTANGSGTMEVTSDDDTASDLKILGQAVSTEDPNTGVATQTIDGSYELRITVDSDDTLQDVADKINEAAGGQATASIINDGSGTNPYRLTLQSQVSGTVGRLVFDGGQSGLRMNTLVEARDAVVIYGQASTGNSIVIRSSTNSLDNVIEGVSLDLLGTSSDPITVSVTESSASAVETVSSFVDAFNDVIDLIEKLTAYDTETETRGVLMGESTVSSIRSQLYSMVQKTIASSTGPYTQLNQLGITIGGGAKLQFDSAKFLAAYKSNPDGVISLFTKENTGLAASIDSILDGLTNSADGMLARKDDALEDKYSLLEDRIADMEDRLDAKEARLYSQFYAMESALAGLQSQSSALESLSGLVTSLKSSQSSSSSK